MTLRKYCSLASVLLGVFVLGADTSDTAPAGTVPADTTSADTVAADTVLADTTPVDAAPADTAPADTVAADTVAADTAPADTTPKVLPTRSAGDPHPKAQCKCVAPKPLLAASAEIHGQKWNDLDGDGERDAGEPGLNGWVIELFDDRGALVATQTTADIDLDGSGTIDPETERGLYWFTGLDVKRLFGPESEMKSAGSPLFADVRRSIDKFNQDDKGSKLGSDDHKTPATADSDQKQTPKLDSVNQKPVVATSHNSTAATCGEDTCGEDTCGDEPCRYFSGKPLSEFTSITGWKPSEWCESLYKSANNGSWSSLLNGGVEATFLYARLDRATSSVAAFDDTDELVTGYSADVRDNDDLNGAPRVWLGGGNGCWGVVGRWWDYRAGDADFRLREPDIVGLNSSMRAYTADLEITRRWCKGCVTGGMSFGARHANLSSQTGVSLRSVIGHDDVFGVANTDREFEGSGLTFGIQATRPLNDLCRGMSLFSSVRGSYLWGDARSASSCGTSLVSNHTEIFATQADNNAFAATDNGGMLITEMQTGLEWKHKIKCTSAIAFFRLAAEWQQWIGDTVIATGAASTSLRTPGAIINTNADAGDQALDLLGLAVAAGITY